MKFFLDTANTEEIKTGASYGIIDGVTTNPSLMAKTGKTMDQAIHEIVEIINGPISVEVLSTDAKSIIAEGKKYAAIHKNIVVKCPMTTDGIKATYAFSNEGIATNVTLVFSASQALLAAKAGATYVSPFIGRLDDQSHDGMALIEDIVDIFDNYSMGTEVLAASIRHPRHVVDCALAGADVGTMPLKVIDQLFKHPLTDLGLEKFLKDAQKIPQ